MRNETTMILGAEGCEDCAKLKAHLIDAETANATQRARGQARGRAGSEGDQGSLRLLETEPQP
jgi:hypothetical protein